MARPKRVTRIARKEIRLPEDLFYRVELELLSPIEGRVPYEAWSGLVERLLREALAKLDASRRESPANLDCNSSGNMPS